MFYIIDLQSECVIAGWIFFIQLLTTQLYKQSDAQCDTANWIIFEPLNFTFLSIWKFERFWFSYKFQFFHHFPDLDVVLLEFNI